MMLRQALNSRAQVILCFIFPSSWDFRCALACLASFFFIFFIFILFNACHLTLRGVLLYLCIVLVFISHLLLTFSSYSSVTTVSVTTQFTNSVAVDFLVSLVIKGLNLEQLNSWITGNSYGTMCIDVITITLPFLALVSFLISLSDFNPHFQ